MYIFGCKFTLTAVNINKYRANLSMDVNFLVWYSDLFPKSVSGTKCQRFRRWDRDETAGRFVKFCWCAHHKIGNACIYGIFRVLLKGYSL